MCTHVQVELQFLNMRRESNRYELFAHRGLMVLTNCDLILERDCCRTGSRISCSSLAASWAQILRLHPKGRRGANAFMVF